MLGFTRAIIRRKPNEIMRLSVTILAALILGFCLGVSIPTISLATMHLPSSLLPSIDMAYIDERFGGSATRALFGAWSSLRGGESTTAKIWVGTNPRGAERLPPGIVEPLSDLYLRRLWGLPSEDLIKKPRYLVTFTVGYDQRHNIDAAVKKFSENFTIMLFHYDGRSSEWDEFDWSKSAIHVSGRKQTKWWFAKRFMHPDIVAPYDYIFMWDEDLGVEHFDAEEYIKLVKKYGLEISQPGLDPSKGTTWEMTKKVDGSEVHKLTEEKPGRCSDPHAPPCAAFVEIMATVFSRGAWRCVWHMIQNDLIHGWGLDFALRRCVEAPAYEKIGVVDSQWIVHQSVPSLGSQGQGDAGRAPWEGVRERCHKEWEIFKHRMRGAEKSYLDHLGIQYVPFNSTFQ